MSATTAEAPKTDKPADPPKGFTPVTFALDQALQSASRKAALGRPGVKPVESKAAESKEPDKPVDPPKEEKTETIPVEEKKDAVKPADTVIPPVEEKKTDAPLSPKATENFKVVLTRAETAEARIKEMEQELEKARSTPPAEIQTKLTDYEKRLEALQKSESEMREKVRAVDITLDPKFNEEFTAPVLKAQQGVFDLLLKGGATREEATAAVQQWDDTTFSEVTANMPDIQKRRVDAAILEAERLANARNAQIKAPEDYQARRRQQDEEHQRRAVTDRERLAADIFTGIIDSTPVLKGDEYKPLRETVNQQLARAAKGEIGVKELMGKIAQAEVLQIALQGQHAALEEQAKEIDALKKELADANTFVKANGSSTLKTETGNAPGTDAHKPIWERLAVKPPR